MKQIRSPGKSSSLVETIHLQTELFRQTKLAGDAKGVSRRARRVPPELGTPVLLVLNISVTGIPTLKPSVTGNRVSESCAFNPVVNAPNATALR
jgi:hypothetical protein